MHKKLNFKEVGFTLIELMIVVAIIGILTSIAYPSYQESVAKSRRADAEGALLSLANKMERYFTVNNTYVGATAVTSDSTDYYALTIPALTLTATGYVLSAAPAISDHCGTLTYTSVGVKGVIDPSTGYTAANCW